MARKKNTGSAARGKAARSNASPPPEPAFNPAFAALSGLRKNLTPQASPQKAKPEAILPKATPPEATPPAGEEALFRAEMADVVPLASPEDRRRPKEIPPPRAWAAPALPDEDIEVLRGLADLVSGKAQFDLIHTAEYVEGRTRGLPSRLMDQLRAGRISYQDHLDLHGLTITRAEAAVAGFILDSVTRNRRCVLIIHGRGLGSPDGVPVLKSNLESFLLRGPARKYILAFTTARPVDGGLGASYVLLRG
jgi:DNA-nicking Smr family endonuclease